MKSKEQSWVVPLRLRLGQEGRLPTAVIAAITDKEALSDSDPKVPLANA